jgi:hypothetical protein
MARRANRFFSRNVLIGGLLAVTAFGVQLAAQNNSEWTEAFPPLHAGSAMM